MAHLRLVHSVSDLRPSAAPWCFTSRDLGSLSTWAQCSSEHGYRRVLVEIGAGSGQAEEGGYVLIYSGDTIWARWGIARSEDAVVVWHCGTSADRGRFDTMQAALDSLPPAMRALPRTCEEDEQPRVAFI